MRFLLGVAEAGFFPSVIYYFSGWFPMSWRGRAVSRIYAPPFPSIAMGAMSGALLGFDGMAGLQGWQWLFLMQGLPAVLLGLIVLRFLPAASASADWLAEPEKAWIARELDRDEALIGTPERHGLLAAFANPKVALFDVLGFLGNSASIGVLLSAPAVLVAGTALEVPQVGYVTSLGGIVGVACLLFAGWKSDRGGDRLRDASAYVAVTTVGLLLVGVAATPALVIFGYLLFVGSGFTAGMLLVSARADALSVRQLAVGGAAINTLWQIGAFLSPFAFGIVTDATGSFRVAVMGASILAAAQGLLILYVRARLLAERRERALALERSVALAS